MGKEIAKLGLVSTESVEKCTGKGWSQWVALLDRAGAANWPHREITLLLKSKYKLTPWWQQGVAIGYEIHHGRRVVGRNDKGLYSLTATKTVELSRPRAWKFLASPEGLALWLAPFAPFDWKKGATYEVDGGIFGEVRTVKAPERLRFSWQEDSWAKPSIVQLNVNLRPGNKCLVVIQHEGVPSESAKEKLRVRWRAALEHVAAQAAETNGAAQAVKNNGTAEKK
jgi:uncharacterized protein YndB with AHSA1/START domain